jgi:hypothetical protein
MATFQMMRSASERPLRGPLLLALLLVCSHAFAATQLLLPKYVTLPGASPLSAVVSPTAKAAAIYQNLAGSWLEHATVSGAKGYATAASNPIFEGGVARNLKLSSPLISGLSQAEAATLSSGITGTAVVNQSLAKRLAVNALRLTPLAIGVGLTAWALSDDLSYFAGEWHKSSTLPGLLDYVPSGGVGPSSACNAPGGCSNYAVFYSMTTSQWNDLCGSLNGIAAWDGTNGYCHLYTSPVTSPVVATSADFDHLADTPASLTDAQLAEMIAAGYAVPIGDIDPEILAQARHITYGLPYTNPVTGEHLQPMLALDVAGSSVRATGYDTPLDASGVPLNGPDGLPIKQETASDPVPPVDPCVANPGSLACQGLGSLDPADDPVQQTRSLSFTPGTLATAGSCPAPYVGTIMGGHTLSFDYQPVCDAATNYVKPLVLVFAAVAAYMIFIGGLRT